MSQIDDNDQAAEEAAELLPCQRYAKNGGVHLPGTCLDCGSECGCVQRPAVAERLANYREQLRQRDEKIEHNRKALETMTAAAQAFRERIAALEARINAAEEVMGGPLEEQASDYAAVAEQFGQAAEGEDSVAELVRAALAGRNTNG